MASDQFRVRVSLQTGELEVEGSESFVSSFREEFDDLIGRIGSTPAVAAPPAGAAASPSAAKQEPLTESFPETLHGLPKGASGTDQILVAGKFASLQTADATFGTAEASALLIEQGIKLSNPSQSMKNNLVAKRVFKAGARWRISKTGEDHLRTLIPTL